MLPWASETAGIKRLGLDLFGVQDEAWREQQRRLLTAQFGPREVESLAMNSVLPLALPEQEALRPLGWVQERELYELQVWIHIHM